MLGWDLYLIIALSTGSKLVSELRFTMYVFLFIFKFETVFLKKLFNPPAIEPLFKKKGLPKKIVIFHK